MGKPLTHAERQRLYRKRQHENTFVAQVPVTQELVELFISTGRVSEAASMNRECIESAIETYLGGVSEKDLAQQKKP